MHSRSLIIMAGLILASTLAVFLSNHFIYQFPGNDYFPDNVLILALILIVFNSGLSLCFNKDSYPRRAGKELICFFAVMSLIALATNAIQLTPFPTIDQKILSLESRFGINLTTVMTWANQHPHSKNLLIRVYDTLPYQMSIIPLLVIANGHFSLIRDYYFLLLYTVLFGFGFYYFFPTTAPASVIYSTLFSPDQIATGLKFAQIHHHITPTTNEGGLIAFPSFHVIWAVLCVYLLKNWFIPWLFLLFVNLLLIASCVLLGWHYPTDVLGAIVCVASGFYFLKKSRQSSQAPCLDESIVTVIAA